MNDKLQEYLKSSVITFISAFLLTLSAMPIDLENMSRGAFIALMLTCVRAGIKAVAQYLGTR